MTEGVGVAKNKKEIIEILINFDIKTFLMPSRNDRQLNFLKSGCYKTLMCSVMCVVTLRRQRNEIVDAYVAPFLTRESSVAKWLSHSPCKPGVAGSILGNN